MMTFMNLVTYWTLLW